MPPPIIPDNPRRALLRVTVKLMLFALLAALALTMARAFLPKGEHHPAAPLRVDVAQLPPGGSQGVEWQARRQRLLVVRPGKERRYLAFFDYDPLYGCPLRWVPSGDSRAPRQPWPGGLRAICTEHWFDAQGRALSDGVADLRRVPFTLEPPAILLFTTTD